jgi:hypothetical protein
MQQAPGQQAPPPQQPASLDEIVVALVSVVIAAIKSKYFMIFSCWDFVSPRLRKLTRSARVFCAEPNAVGENQIRGGGVGGRSIRADAVASSIAKVWPLKRGVENLSEIGQKRINVEHETVQQLPGCDLCPHGSWFDVCSGIILHPDILEQQSGAFVTATKFGFATSGQRKVTRQTINKALRPTLRMTFEPKAGRIEIKACFSISTDWFKWTFAQCEYVQSLF